MLEIIGHITKRIQIQSASKGRTRKEDVLPYRFARDLDTLQEDPDETVNKPLLKVLISVDREFRLHAGRQACIDYWRYHQHHDGDDGDVDRTIFRTILENRTLSQPGMGLDLYCLATFVSLDDKDKILHDQILRRSTDSSSDTYSGCFQRLSEDQCLMMSVLRMIQTASDSLSKLADSTNTAIKSLVSACALTPTNALSKLTIDEDFEVRFRVAANHSTSKDDLLILCQDEASVIKERAQQTLREQEDANRAMKEFLKLINPELAESLMEESNNAYSNMDSSVQDYAIKPVLNRMVSVYLNSLYRMQERLYKKGSSQVFEAVPEGEFTETIESLVESAVEESGIRPMLDKKVIAYLNSCLFQSVPEKVKEELETEEISDDRIESILESVVEESGIRPMLDKKVLDYLNSLYKVGSSAEYIPAVDDHGNGSDTHASEETIESVDALV